MFRKKEVVLQRKKNQQNSITVKAKLIENGDLRIDGHDLTHQDKNMFGAKEYEWALIVSSDNIPQLQKELGSQADILKSLKLHFSDDNSAKLKSFLEEHQIQFKFWNRVGD